MSEKYLIPIQLENVTEKLKVTNLTTNGSINQGITNMYTNEDRGQSLDIFYMLQ